MLDIVLERVLDIVLGIVLDRVFVWEYWNLD